MSTDRFEFTIEDTELDQRVYEANDAGNAEYVADLLADQALHTGAYGWMGYTGTHWNNSDTVEPALKKAVIEALRLRQARAWSVGSQEFAKAIMKAAKPNRNRISAVLNLLPAYLSTGVSSFDSSPDELNCKNGVLDLRTGTLTPHNPRQRFTYSTGVRYDPNADMSIWMKVLRGIFNDDDETIEYLQRAVGYSLTGHIREETFFYIWGPTRSGKGTFTETLMQVLGNSPLAAEVGFNTFTIKRGNDSDNFDLAPLKPCRFVAASESRKRQRLNSSDVKRFTGGNSIRCSFKGKQVFQYRPKFKIWLSSNFEVRADGDDEALWTRLRIIRFPKSFKGQEDKQLKEDLKKPEALEGVLRWAVEGAKRWYALGRDGLQVPESIARNAREARAANDPVGQWIVEHLRETPNPDCFTPNEDLYKSYGDYCKRNGLRYPKTMNNLTRSLKRKGYDAGVVSTVNEKSTRGCRGVSVV